MTPAEEDAIFYVAVALAVAAIVFAVWVFFSDWTPTTVTTPAVASCRDGFVAVPSISVEPDGNYGRISGVVCVQGYKPERRR